MVGCCDDVEYDEVRFDLVWVGDVDDVYVCVEVVGVIFVEGLFGGIDYDN